MADNRTMAQMLQAPIEGYEDAIVILQPSMPNGNFDTKQPLINLVQSNKFTDALDSSATGGNILGTRSSRRFLRLLKASPKVLTLEVRANDFQKKLCLLLNSSAPIKAVEEVCVTCGSNHHFNLCPLTRSGNDFPVFHDNIQQFQQTAAVGNFLQRNQPSNLASQMRPPGFNQPNVQNNPNRYQGTNSNFNQNRGGNFNQNRQNNQNQVYQGAVYQTPTNQPPINQVVPYQPLTNSVLKTDFESYVKANDAVLKNVQNQNQGLQNQMANVTSLLTSLCTKINDFSNPNQASSSSTLPSNTIPNPRNEARAITTRSGVSYEGPSIPMPPPFVNPDVVEETSTEHVPPPLTQKVQETNSQTTTKVNQEGIVNNPKTYELKLPYPERRNVEKGKKKIRLGFLTNLESTQMPLELATVRLLSTGWDLLVISNTKNFTDNSSPPNSLPPGDDISILKKDFQEETFRIISNPLFEFDDNFKSSNVNPLFEENDKDVKIKSSSSSTLTSPEASKLEAYLEKDSIPPGIDLTFPPIFKISSSNPTSPTLTGEKVCSWKTPMFLSLVRFVWKMMTRIEIRKQIICLLATHLHKKPKPRPQKVKEIKENEEEVSRDVPINIIVMPIQITFDNPIDFNDHLSKPKDLKKDLPISFDSTTESSILPHPLLDSDSPFTAELSASVTLNSLGNEDKVFKPGILVYHAIHDKNLITLKEKLKENISSRTLLVFKEPSFLLPPAEPPDECLKNAVLNFYQSTDKSKITRKQSKASKHGHENQKSSKRSQRSKALANFHLQGPFLQFPKLFITRNGITKKGTEIAKRAKSN
ncbi:hypothetical protein Tco_0237345 [Tanacetum coccineum]